MDPKVEEALKRDRLIDITTVGRRSGQPRRKEMGFHNLDGDIFITGIPGKRDWYANVVARPEFTIHVKQSAEADLPARATPIEDSSARREILEQILERMNRSEQLDEWVAHSPLIAVELLHE